MVDIGLQKFAYICEINVKKLQVIAYMSMMRCRFELMVEEEEKFTAPSTYLLEIVPGRN